MAIREDFGAALTLVDGGDGTWSPVEAAPAHARRDWQPLYEQERARAEAAEARCEELRRAELASRSRAGSLKSQLDASRNKLKAAAEEIREVRRTAKNALALQAEVTRLEKLLSEAGVDRARAAGAPAPGKVEADALSERAGTRADMMVKEAGREARAGITRQDALKGHAGVAVEVEKPFERHATENLPVVGEWLAGKLYGTAKNAVPDGTDRPARSDPDWGNQSP